MSNSLSETSQEMESTQTSTFSQSYTTAPTDDKKEVKLIAPYILTVCIL